ncbi:MAG: CapA family protein [Crocinitomicaceae bacterium]|nr:CapA family protein [Crocinitomicaceae bacterium]
MKFIENSIVKSLLLGLFFFSGSLFAQKSTYVEYFLEKTGIQNAKDLEEAANNSLDQLEQKYQEALQKIQQNHPGSIQNNITLSAMNKVEEKTKNEVKLIQYISEKCWADKGFDPLFFTKNMEHLAKMRDTAIGDYAYFATMHHSKKKLIFDRDKYDLNADEGVMDGTKKLEERDRDLILAIHAMYLTPSGMGTADYNEQLATFRLIQLEYKLIQLLIAENHIHEKVDLDYEKRLNEQLKSEYGKLVEFREQVRLDSIRKAEEKAKLDSIANSKKNRTYHVVGVGDMMLGTNFPNESYLPPSNVKLLDPVKEYLQNADCTFGNLEGTVLDKGGDVKHCSNPSICYAFRMPVKYVDEVKEAGFDLISVANNHVGDFGESGRTSTTQVLKEKGFCFAGLLSRPWDTLTINGLKYGLVAFSPNTGTVRINNYPEAIRIVKELDKMCDVVVVSFHGGAEGSKHQHMPKQTEIFYGENRGNVYEFAHLMIDNGADLVFGHGPHVTRAIDIYKDRFITYSMGNFCTYHRFNLSGVSGMAPIYDIEIKNDGTFIKGRVISTRQYGEGGPVVDSQKNALRLVKELTASDVPELKLKWDGEYFTLPE